MIQTDWTGSINKVISNSLTQKVKDNIIIIFPYRPDESLRGSPDVAVRNPPLTEGLIIQPGKAYVPQKYVIR